MQNCWDENNAKADENRLSEILLELTKGFFANSDVFLKKLCFETVKFLFLESIDRQITKTEK